MTVTIDIPRDVLEQASAIAESEEVTLGEVLAAAFREHAAAWRRLQERAKKGSLEDIKRILANVPDVEPEEYDRLPERTA